METLPRQGLRREDMLKRVARFKDLNGYNGGLPDSDFHSAVRTLYNVIGFQPPKGEGGAVDLAGGRRRRAHGGDQNLGRFQSRILPRQARQGPDDA